MKVDKCCYERMCEKLVKKSSTENVLLCSVQKLVANILLVCCMSKNRTKSSYKRALEKAN